MASAHAAVKARAASGTTRRAECLRFTDTSRGVALGIDHWLPRRSRQWAANHLFIGLLCQGLARIGLRRRVACDDQSCRGNLFGRAPLPQMTSRGNPTSVAHYVIERKLGE